MSEIQIALIELITVGGPGVIFIFYGVIGTLLAKRQKQLCTEQTEGIVRKHGFPGDGRMYPIVEYCVDGTCYKTKKKFKGVKTKRIAGLPIQGQTIAYEDEKGWLHVTIGSIANMRQLAEQLWPIGSRMTVYYDPNSPKRCYVDRPITKNLASILFILTGMITVAMSILVFFLIQL